MATLDAFNTSEFRMSELSASMVQLPRKPSLIRDMGIFVEKPIRTTSVWVEEKNGKLAIVASSKRGGPGVPLSAALRTGRQISTTHHQLDDAILAEDVQNIRAFGSETELQGLQAVTNDHLQEGKDDLDVTIEYQLAGALQGKVYDSNGSTVLHNLFTDFNVSEQTKDFVFTSATTKILNIVLEALELAEDALGAMNPTGWRAICGATWFKAFTQHALVRDTFANWESNAALRADNRKGFVFGGVEWIQYRYTVSSNLYLPAAQARIFPLGIPNLYQLCFAPADYTETVNTRGLPYYGKIERMPFDKGVWLQMQTNPLAICTMPAALIKCTQS